MALTFVCVTVEKKRPLRVQQALQFSIAHNLLFAQTGIAPRHVVVVLGMKCRYSKRRGPIVSDWYHVGSATEIIRRTACERSVE